MRSCDKNLGRKLRPTWTAPRWFYRITSSLLSRRLGLRFCDRRSLSDFEKNIVDCNRRSLMLWVKYQHNFFPYGIIKAKLNRSNLCCHKKSTPKIRPWIKCVLVLLCSSFNSQRYEELSKVFQSLRIGHDQKMAAIWRPLGRIDIWVT